MLFLICRKIENHSENTHQDTHLASIHPFYIVKQNDCLVSYLNVPELILLHEIVQFMSKKGEKLHILSSETQVYDWHAVVRYGMVTGEMTRPEMLHKVLSLYCTVHHENIFFFFLIHQAEC